MTSSGPNAGPDPDAVRTSPRVLSIAGVVLVSVAIGTCLLLGTLGWFAVGFGVMTDCTNNYSCTETGCDPCAPAARWINAGGVIQLALALAGVIVLIVGLRSSHQAYLLLGGVGLLAASAATVLGTTWAADESYCRPGTPGYAASYCSIDD
jgi:hypothetical protein